jgi:hypothetical protein
MSLHRSDGSRESDPVLTLASPSPHPRSLRFREKEGFELMEKCLKENKIAAGRHLRSPIPPPLLNGQ